MDGLREQNNGYYSCVTGEKEKRKTFPIEWMSEPMAMIGIKEILYFKMIYQQNYEFLNEKTFLFSFKTITMLKRNNAELRRFFLSNFKFVGLPRSCVLHTNKVQWQTLPLSLMTVAPIRFNSINWSLRSVTIRSVHALNVFVQCVWEIHYKNCRSKTLIYNEARAHTNNNYKWIKCEKLQFR